MAVNSCTKDGDLVLMVDLVPTLVEKRMMKQAMVHVKQKIKHEYAKEILSYELKTGWDALHTEVMSHRNA